jgi:DNA gyrase subunit A
MLEDELKRSYLDYAMSVIVSRALPDVRDGLKPVHRRILFSMHENGYHWNRPIASPPAWSATSSVSITRMATVDLRRPGAHGAGFLMRLPLIDGQGNFGSVDGDPPAAMRYTEVRMAKIAHALTGRHRQGHGRFSGQLRRLESEPSVLPARFPNLLVNGAAASRSAWRPTFRRTIWAK